MLLFFLCNDIQASKINLDTASFDVKTSTDSRKKRKLILNPKPTRGPDQKRYSTIDLN